MVSRFLLDTAGNIRLGIRRALFGVTALSMFASMGVAVTERASARSYATELPVQSSFKVAIMESAQNNFAGIETGKVYEGKAPQLVQTMHGQSVYNDRKITGIEPNGSLLANAEISYVSGASDVPEKTTLAAFLDWVGRDVTEALPPANSGEGQAGGGKDWRPFSGAAATVSYEAVKPNAEGSPNITAPFNAERNELPEAQTGTVAARTKQTEGGEGGQPVEVTERPASAPNADTLTEAVADSEPKPTKFSNDTSDKSATASGETLRTRALRH